MRPITRLLSFAIVALSIGVSGAFGNESAYDRCVAPYVRGNNFSGVVLVSRGARTLFERAYGQADRERREPNRLTTRFHIASISSQFTAAAVMRLIESGQLALSTPVSDLAPNVPNASKMTIEHLLEQTSGLPDINGFPEYPQLLLEHQTPESLVRRLEGRLPAREPGNGYVREEHSSYNLLALVIERATGKPFARALSELVFDPLAMGDSGIDDDSASTAGMATGYATFGTTDLVAADKLHWSAKSGTGSAFASAPDQLRWMREFFGGRYLSAASRATMLDTVRSVGGYGWFKLRNERLGASIAYMNGRAPGFASFVAYVPSERLAVVLLSNIYSSVPTTIGFDLLAIAMGKPYASLNLLERPLSPGEARGIGGSYAFGPDFYQPNATLKIQANGSDIELRWPSGSVTALIPVSRDSFLDRPYWVPVSLHRDAAGKVTEMRYDRYQGRAVPATQR